MNQDNIKEYCFSKKGVSCDFPFDEQTLVYRVMGKMFLLTDIDGFPISMNLKCDPEKAVELRERYEAIKPGYHMNKKHWNTVLCDGTISDNLILELIDHSYTLVKNSLPKKILIELDSQQ